MTLGKKISDLRKSKSISQELLAENSGVSLRTIQRIEQGASLPRPFTVKVIADALGVPVEQLTSATTNTTPSNGPEADKERNDLAALYIINLSCLAGFILPLSNVILPFTIWKKDKTLPRVNAIGRRIISFQILWTLGTILMILLTLLIQHTLTGAVQIGRLPPTVILVYVILLVINFIFVIRSAIQLKKGKNNIYSFIPTLF